MLYKTAHYIKERIGWLWNLVEGINSCLFSVRYRKKLKAFVFSTVPSGFTLSTIRDTPSQELVDFFEHQPDDAYRYFHPHGFDKRSIEKLQANKSFLGYVLLDETNGQIAGYCFIRCFFNGQGFRGRMVDIDYRGKGLGTAMNRIMNEIGFGIGLRLFESVSKDNVASYRSALSASHLRVVKEMSHNELFLEILPEN